MNKDEVVKINGSVEQAKGAAAMVASLIKNKHLRKKAIDAIEHNYPCVIGNYGRWEVDFQKLGDGAEDGVAVSYDDLSEKDWDCSIMGVVTVLTCSLAERVGFVPSYGAEKAALRASKVKRLVEAAKGTSYSNYFSEEKAPLLSDTSLESYYDEVVKEKAN